MDLTESVGATVVTYGIGIEARLRPNHQRQNVDWQTVAGGCLLKHLPVLLRYCNDRCIIRDALSATSTEVHLLAQDLIDSCGVGLEAIHLRRLRLGNLCLDISPRVVAIQRATCALRSHTTLAHGGLVGLILKLA